MRRYSLGDCCNVLFPVGELTLLRMRNQIVCGGRCV